MEVFRFGIRRARPSPVGPLCAPLHSFSGSLTFPSDSPINLTGGGERRAMIHLTRLNGNPLVINSDLIKYAESSPDTMLTLVNGEKIVVLESCEEVIERTIAYRARVFGEATRSMPGPGWSQPEEGVRPAARPDSGEPGE